MHLFVRYYLFFKLILENSIDSEFHIEYNFIVIGGPNHNNRLSCKSLDPCRHIQSILLCRWKFP